MNRIALVGMAALLSGCAVSKDGIGFAHRSPTDEQIGQARTQLTDNASSAAAKDGDEGVAQGLQPGIVIIGTTGPLRALNDTQRQSYYHSYVAFASKWHPGQPPALDAAAFREKLGGWASLQTGGIPGIVYTRVRILVPSDHLKDTRFASAAGSFMFGTTGDLVAAKTDRDGLVWLERVLCPDDSTYQNCAKAYQHGIFDANTGQELDKDRKPRSGGRMIDIESYVILPTKRSATIRSE